jgi:uncharacterized protein YdeI (YjbR/CyaY-like superfamily)
LDIRNTLYVAGRAEWRDWLEQNHDRESEIWLVFHKGRTRPAPLSYDDAVEEALCFGWIDSIVKRIDDEKYAQRFSPRRDGSRWSLSNRRRIAKLIREGRMTPAGLAKLSYPDPATPPADEREPEPALAREIEEALRANEAAWAAFDRLAPSHRRNLVRWLMNGKRAETQRRRLAEVIDLLLNGRPLGLK